MIQECSAQTNDCGTYHTPLNALPSLLRYIAVYSVSTTELKRYRIGHFMSRKCLPPDFAYYTALRLCKSIGCRPNPLLQSCYLTRRERAQGSNRHRARRE